MIREEELKECTFMPKIMKNKSRERSPEVVKNINQSM